jgi:excisionase family DNA binding protein
MTTDADGKLRSPLLTAPEAAGYLRISESGLRNKVAAREIPFVRLGTGSRSRLVFEQAALDDYIAACREPVLNRPRHRQAS